MKIRDEEGKENVNSKEAVDNVVKYDKAIYFVFQKCKLERRNPSRVYDKNQ